MIGLADYIWFGAGGGRFAQLLHRFNQGRNFTADHGIVIADLLSRGKTNARPTLMSGGMVDVQLGNAVYQMQYPFINPKAWL